jgi:FAD/FMN-containing dehydrogenase
MSMEALAARLAAIVGAHHVLTDDVTAAYGTDWTRRWEGRPRLVVRPGSTAEVAAVVAACGEAGAAIVPQGGNTGLVGGAVPRAGEVVLSLRRLDALEPVDRVAAQLTAGSGVTLAAAQRHARAVGLDVGVDFAARDDATLGGMVATNAGGERVLRYGTMRAQVRGLEAVLADGTVVTRLSGLPKDNVGYDLAGLLVGSEGTLGVVTRVRLALVPVLPARVAALLALPDTAAAVDVVAAVRRSLPALESAELFFAAGLDLVCAARRMAPPFADPHPVYVLLECADHHDPTDALAAALADLGDVDVRDAAVAADPTRRQALWEYREAHTDAINTAGVPLKLDVAVPPGRLAEFDDRLRAVVADLAPDARLVVFGHLAEGNLHVNLLDAGTDESAEAITEAVLGLVAEFDGSISAEHGVGQAKVRWVHLSRTPQELAAMRAVKEALDPRWLLNPGVLLPRGVA